MDVSVGPSSSVSTRRLRSITERLVSDYFGRPIKFQRFERRTSEYSSSFQIEELSIRLEDGTDLALIFKNVGSDGFLPEAWRVKPRLLYNPLRELEVYRSLISPEQHGTATFYGAFVDRQAEQYWLFIKRIGGVELYQVGDFEVWLEAARWLGRFNRCSQGLVLGAASHVPLVRCDESLFAVWASRAQRILESKMPSDSQRIDLLLQAYARGAQRLLKLPVTVLHGDFFPSNVMVETHDTGRARIVPVDWEMAAVGPAVYDLATLVSGRWTPEEEKALIDAYFTAWKGVAASCQADPEFCRDLDCARLVRVMQWVGWSSNWIPPQSHQQDWLAQAMALVERLNR